MSMAKPVEGEPAFRTMLQKSWLSSLEYRMSWRAVRFSGIRLGAKAERRTDREPGNCGGVLTER